MNTPMIQFTCAVVLFMAANLHGAERVLSPEEAKAKKAWLDWEKQQTEKERALVPQLHRTIVATSHQTSEAEMKLYTNIIVVTDRGGRLSRANDAVAVVSVMVPIKGGEFMMGSPEAEARRRRDEGPQHKVKIAPFWMQQCEITWDEYEPFMLNIEEANPKDTTYASNSWDAVSKPSKPYVDPSRLLKKACFEK